MKKKERTNHADCGLPHRKRKESKLTSYQVSSPNSRLALERTNERTKQIEKQRTEGEISAVFIVIFKEEEVSDHSRG